jgi:hypothetical protein
MRTVCIMSNLRLITDCDAGTIITINRGWKNHSRESSPCCLKFSAVRLRWHIYPCQIGRVSHPWMHRHLSADANRPASRLRALLTHHHTGNLRPARADKTVGKLEYHRHGVGMGGWDEPRVDTSGAGIESSHAQLDALITDGYTTIACSDTADVPHSCSIILEPLAYPQKVTRRFITSTL